MKKAIVLALAILALNSTKALAATDLQCVMKALAYGQDVRDPDQKISYEYVSWDRMRLMFVNNGCKDFFDREAYKIAHQNFKSEVTPRKLAWAIAQSRISYCSLSGIKLEIRDVMKDDGFNQISDSAPIMSGAPSITLYPPAIFGLNYYFWNSGPFSSTPEVSDLNKTVPQFAKLVLMKRHQSGECK
jgi:hypothetical protein